MCDPAVPRDPEDSTQSSERLRAELARLLETIGGDSTVDSDGPNDWLRDPELLTGGALDACRSALQRLCDRSALECREIDPTIVQVLSVVAATAQAHGVLLRERRQRRVDGLSELAHRMNNPLTTILGRAQILRARPGQDAGVVKAATAIESAVQSLAGLVRELATIAREMDGPEREARATRQLTGV